MAETLPSTIEAPLSERPGKAENVFVDGGGRWWLLSKFSGFCQGDLPAQSVKRVLPLYKANVP